MSAKSILSSSSEELKESRVAHGSGTKLSGYVDDPTPKRCNTCEYFVGTKLCNNKVVARDKQVPKDSKTGLKIVHPVHGCCSFWEPKD